MAQAVVLFSALLRINSVKAEYLLYCSRQLFVILECYVYLFMTTFQSRLYNYLLVIFSSAARRFTTSKRTANIVFLSMTNMPSALIPIGSPFSRFKNTFI